MKLERPRHLQAQNQNHYTHIIADLSDGSESSCNNMSTTESQRHGEIDKHPVYDWRFHS